MVNMLTCLLQLKWESKTEYPFFMYRFFVKMKHFPLLSVYHKLTFSEACAHCGSFLPIKLDLFVHLLPNMFKLGSITH